MKRITESPYLLAFILVLTLVASVAAETPESLLAPAKCSAGEPDLLWLTGGTCGQSFCQSDEYCWNNCPDALTASCAGGVCQYTYPGGGTGGGGGLCYQSLCSTDAQCTCPDGTLRQCINNVCV